MTDSDRRDFLKKSAAAAAALGIPGAAAGAPQAGPGGGAAAGTDGITETAAATGQAATEQAPTATARTLRSIADAVLPAGDLGADGIERVVTDFEDWIEGFEPVAELPHGYLNRGLAEIRYGPAHPGPRWGAQLEALELEATRRHRASFAELDLEERRALIERQLERDELGRIPDPAGARHVAIGLLAFFYDSSEATDLCYRASIGRFRCRGLATLGREPQALSPGAPEDRGGS